MVAKKKQKREIQKSAKNKQIVQLNHPEYLQKHLWPLVVEFNDIVKTPGISAHSLMTYMLYGIQSKTVIIWIAVIDGKPVGFITFQQAGPPNYSTGQITTFYMQVKDRELSRGLVDKFLEFMKINKLLYAKFDVSVEKLAERYKEIIDEIQWSLLATKEYFYVKRKIGD